MAIILVSIPEEFNTSILREKVKKELRGHSVCFNKWTTDYDFNVYLVSNPLRIQLKDIKKWLDKTTPIEMPKVIIATIWATDGENLWKKD